MIVRSILSAVALFLLAAAYRHAQTEALLGAGAGAVIAWAIVSWMDARYCGEIVRRARVLAHAFALTNKPCIEETRALSRAVFLGE